MLNVIIVIATYQGREGVDQLFCLNCNKGGGVPKNEAKTIQREPLDIIRLKNSIPGSYPWRPKEPEFFVSTR